MQTGHVGEQQTVFWHRTKQLIIRAENLDQEALGGAVCQRLAEEARRCDEDRVGEEEGRQ